MLIEFRYNFAITFEKVYFLKMLLIISNKNSCLIN